MKKMKPIRCFFSVCVTAPSACLMRFHKQFETVRSKRLGYHGLKINEVISVLTTALPQLGRSRNERH